MSKATQRAIAVLEEARTGGIPDYASLVEKGKHLPSHEDILQAHQVFTNCLDQNHPQAVEMLLAVEELRQMTDELRADRDALQPLLESTTTLLGCAEMLSQGCQEDVEEAIQNHLFDLLNYLTKLSATRLEYDHKVASIGAYQRA